MNVKPLVSISCITYNHAPYIRQCLEGFITQKTNFAYEVLIHDDASTDGTSEIIQEYENKYPDIIKPIYESENQYHKGVPIGSEVWNVPRAQGKYIALCEGDDYWTDPNKLQKQVDYMEQHPEIDLCCTASKKYVQKTGKFIGHVGTSLCEKYDTCIMGYNDIFTATTLIRADSFRKCYAELISFLSQDLIIDTAYWYWFAYYNKIKYFDEETAVYRILENSACHTTDNTKAVWNQWRFLRLKLSFLIRYPLKENQEQVKKSIFEEIEKHVQYAQYVSEEKVRHSKTYKIGHFIKKIIKK